MNNEDKEDQKASQSRKEYQRLWAKRKKEKIKEAEEDRKRKNREKVAKWRQAKPKTYGMVEVELEQQPLFQGIVNRFVERS